MLQVIPVSSMLDVTSKTVKSVAFFQFSGLPLHHVASVPVAVCVCVNNILRKVWGKLTMMMFLKVRDPKSQAVSKSSIANTAEPNSLVTI